jgi:hypothetical protein
MPSYFTIWLIRRMWYFLKSASVLGHFYNFARRLTWWPDGSVRPISCSWCNPRVEPSMSNDSGYMSSILKVWLRMRSTRWCVWTSLETAWFSSQCIETCFLQSILSSIMSPRYFVYCTRYISAPRTRSRLGWGMFLSLGLKITYFVLLTLNLGSCYITNCGSLADLLSDDVQSWTQSKWGSRCRRRVEDVPSKGTQKCRWCI